MSDLGQMMAYAIGLQLMWIAAVIAVVSGGLGWAVGHFLF